MTSQIDHFLSITEKPGFELGTDCKKIYNTPALPSELSHFFYQVVYQRQSFCQNVLH